MNRWLKILLGIGTSLLMFYFLMWIGIKGLLGIVVGMSFMSFLLLSKNPILASVIKMTQSEWYMDDIRKGKL